MFFMINLLCLDHVESLINTVIGPPGVVSVQLDLSFVPSMFVKFGKTTPWRLIEAGDCQNCRFQFTHCLGFCKIMRWYITKRKGKASELLRAENTILFKTLRKTSHAISNGGVEVFGFLLDQMRCTVFIILCTTAIFTSLRDGNRPHRIVGLTQQGHDSGFCCLDAPHWQRCRPTKIDRER